MAKVAVALVKYFLLGCNVFFMIASVVGFVIGAIRMREEASYKPFVPYRARSMALICSSILVFPIASLASWGIIKKKYVIIYTYGLLASTIMVLTIVLVIMLPRARMEDKEKRKIKNAMMTEFEEYNERNEIETTWDKMQQDLQCCGVYNATDWGDIIPKSCCPEIPEKEQKCSRENLFKHGCLEELVTNAIQFRGDRITWTIICIIFAAVCAVSACFVGNSMKKEQKLVAPGEQREKEEERKKEDQERKEEKEIGRRKKEEKKEEAERRELGKTEEETARDPG